MSDDRLRTLILQALAEVAPEADLDRLDPDHLFRDQIELDSMDYINFVAALGRASGVAIPEGDYYRLATVNGGIRYLQQRLARAG